MFRRVVLTVSDLAASERFYRTVLGAIGRDDRGEFELREGPDVTRGLHLGFAAPSRADVDAFWRAGVDAGFADEWGFAGDEPRSLRDPDGHRVVIVA